MAAAKPNGPLDDLLVKIEIDTNSWVNRSPREKLALLAREVKKNSEKLVTAAGGFIDAFAGLIRSNTESPAVNAWLSLAETGMGLVRVTMAGEVTLLADQTSRTLISVQDDTTIRMADDLDIAPDGVIYFTDATRRYDIENWGMDLLEGRPNGRLLAHDPKSGKTRTVCDNLIFPNGVCLTHDGTHLLVASTWTCQILIFDLANMAAGPRVFLSGLPGYPDNINRASDGGYWIALAGMRNPVFDAAMTLPGVRRRMARQVPPTNWLFGNLNIGGVLKVDGQGVIRQALWDAPDGPLYMITSMREHKGALYLGGVTNDRIGRLALPEADAHWSGPASYWGGQ